MKTCITRVTGSDGILFGLYNVIKKFAVVALGFWVFVSSSQANQFKHVSASEEIESALSELGLSGRSFESSCNFEYLVAIASGLQAESSKTVYHFTEGNNVVLSTVFYPNRDCTGRPLSTFEEHGTMDLKEQKTRDDAQYVDFTFLSVEMSVNAEAGARVANLFGACGFSDWASGKKRDVTAFSRSMTCYGTSVPRKDYNVIKTEGGNLYLGTGTTERDNMGRPLTAHHSKPYHAIKTESKQMM